jgi:hypothetical protein
MTASLRALLAGILDYAGLFPPARLPLEPAIRNYARYRGEPEGWILGRFICPAARLGELSPFVQELFHSEPPLAVAVLGRGGDTAAEFTEGLHADLQAVAEFSGRHGDRVSVDMLELRLPADVLPPARSKILKALLGSMWGDLTMWAFRAWQQKALKDFYEVSLGPDWRATLTAVLRVLPGGFKLRCGGPDAAAFPTAEQVAGVLTACARRNVPFKATAGLHHPIRHFDAQVQTPVHGFLNVFGAGVLATALGLTKGQVRTIVEDEDPSHFVFTDDAFRWKELSAPADAIVRARRERVVSFGSCSFDEPRDDLRALGLL